MSREVEVTGTEMVRRRLLRRGLLSLACTLGRASAGLKVKVAPRRSVGLPAWTQVGLIQKLQRVGQVGSAQPCYQVSLPSYSASSVHCVQLYLGKLIQRQVLL